MAAAFLPAAERSGRRDRICASTLRAGCPRSRAWRAAGPLLPAVVDLAHGLDMAEVAEGAGTEGQVARLEGAGCDRARGAFLAAPPWRRRSPPPGSSGCPTGWPPPPRRRGRSRRRCRSTDPVRPPPPRRRR